MPDRPFVALSAIAGVQGAALVAYAVFDAVEGVRVGTTGPSDVSNVPALLLLVAITAAFGVGMLWIAWGWWRMQRWARAPFVLAQLMAVLIGFEVTQGAGSVERTVGIVCVLVALLGLALTFSPPVSRALAQDQ